MTNHSKNSSSIARSIFVSARAAIVGLAFASISTASFAQATATAEQRQACTGDVFRLCSSDIPNVNRIIACMKRQRSSLSPACKAVFNPETASVTRSVTAPPQNEDWCSFSPEHTSPEHQHWRGWCGSAAR